MLEWCAQGGANKVQTRPRECRREEADGFFLRDVEFLSIVEEWVILGNNSGSSEGGGSGRGRTSHRLVAGTGMFVRLTSNLVTNKALIVTHVLCLLGRGESDGVYVHGVGVAMSGGVRC